DSVVPWMPRNHQPRRDAKVIHISADPLETRYPFRELEADLLVTGSSLAAMIMLRETLAEAMKGKKTAIESRRKALAAVREEIDAKRRKLIETVKDQTPIHPAWLAACINQVKSENAIVISELGAPLPVLKLTKPLSYMGALLSGGLGFGLRAKLAAPEREVIVTVGDGSYMFCNPAPYHYVARAENLPTLTVVANTQSWLAVRQSTLDVFPDGHAARANVMALTELKPSHDYEKVIETCGGRGEKVEGPGDLVPALRRGLEAVRAGTPVTLNVQTQARRELRRRGTPGWKKPKARKLNPSTLTIGRTTICASSSRGPNARARSCASPAPIGSWKWARWPRSSITPGRSRRRSCSRRCRAIPKACGFSPAQPIHRSGSRSRSGCRFLAI